MAVGLISYRVAALLAVLRARWREMRVERDWNLRLGRRRMNAQLVLSGKGQRMLLFRMSVLREEG